MCRGQSNDRIAGEETVRYWASASEADLSPALVKNH